MAARNSIKYLVSKALVESTSDVATQPISFSKLVNCYVDDKVAALVKRGGSVTEAGLPSGLGIPLGAGDFKTATSNELMPASVQTLANFGGRDFYALKEGTWSSVSTSTFTDFDSDHSSIFSQISKRLYIAAGRPALWDGSASGDNNIERVGIVAPSEPLTLGPSVDPTGARAAFPRYMYTFVDSSTELESDFSPISVGVSANTAVTVEFSNLAQTNAEVGHSGVDIIRLYRTTGGSEFFRVADFPLGTTATYTDSFSDNDLGTESAASGEFSTPPAKSFITLAFNKRIWWVDAGDPWTLRYSKPYIGSEKDLQYYPIENRVQLDEPCTGLVWTPNRMFCMHPRGISIISGFSEIDFQYSPLTRHKGTLFPTSVASDGTNLVWLSEDGVVMRNQDGIRRVSLAIQRRLDEFLSRSYSNNIYAWVEYIPYLRQFLFAFSGEALGTANWVNIGTTSEAKWQSDAVGLPEEKWVGVGTELGDNANVALLFGFQPETGNWTEYFFPQVDNDVQGTHTTFLINPEPSVDALAPQNAFVLMGYYDSIEGQVIKTHLPEVGTDDGAAVESEWLTGRIAPETQPNTIMRVEQIQFSNAETDPSTISKIVSWEDTISEVTSSWVDTSTGDPIDWETVINPIWVDTATGAEVTWEDIISGEPSAWEDNSTPRFRYLGEFEDPAENEFDMDLETFTQLGDNHKPRSPRMRWMHLYCKDKDDTPKKILLSDYTLNYRPRLGRSRR